MRFTDQEIADLGGEVKGNIIVFSDCRYKIYAYDTKEKQYVCNLIEEVIEKNE